MKPLPDPLPIVPFTRPATGSARIPGSKSLTNRALLLSALCGAPVELTGALFSEDTILMAQALRKVGFAVTEDAEAETIRVDSQGRGLNLQSAELFVGLAGTAARFLTALCATAPGGSFRVDGVPQMRNRPMRGLIASLRDLGADIQCPRVEGFFPIEIHARGLRGGQVTINASESSQMLSALLMVAPYAKGPVSIGVEGGVRQPFVQMTMRQMAQFGLAATADSAGESFQVPSGSYTSPGTYHVEADATAASYFAALPIATGGTLHLDGLKDAPESLQGDVTFLDVLKDAGAKVARDGSGVSVSFERGWKAVGLTRDFSGNSDTFLTLAAVAPLMDGPTRITGIGHTRKQETDRVAGMARELRRLGQGIIEEEDALTITPRPLVPGVVVDTYRDHRFAMSFGILGCHDLTGDGKPWLSVRDPICCSKTFPTFFQVLEGLRQATL